MEVRVAAAASGRAGRARPPLLSSVVTVRLWESPGWSAVATLRAMPAGVRTGSPSEARLSSLVGSSEDGSENPRLAGDGGSRSRAPGRYSSMASTHRSGADCPGDDLQTLKRK